MLYIAHMEHDDNSLEIFRQHTVAQQRFVYFMLALSATSIAFVVQQTMGRSLAYSLIPLGIAVIAWALSLYFGLQNRRSTIEIHSANLDSLLLNTGKIPNTLLKMKVPSNVTHSQVLVALKERIAEEMEKHSNQSAKYSKRQFKWYIFGVFAFFVWYILEMYLRIGI